jgi:hypothetical protein
MDTLGQTNAPKPTQVPWPSHTSPTVLRPPCVVQLEPSGRATRARQRPAWQTRGWKHCDAAGQSLSTLQRGAALGGMGGPAINGRGSMLTGASHRLWPAAHVVAAGATRREERLGGLGGNA